MAQSHKAIESKQLKQLHVPKVSQGKPRAGHRVSVTPPEYESTQVHHTIYLPKNWAASNTGEIKYPVIVEYTGNQWPQSGSTGRVEDASLGYGISGGRFIWVTLPMIDVDGKQNARRWWGDVDATLAYATKNIPRICDEFGGDPDAVILCGFSRGAIATSFLGLHNDEIAKLWCGFVSHDHFDGQQAWKGTRWGYPLAAYRKDAVNRLRRLNKRPFLVCQSPDTKKVREYLEAHISIDSFTFVDADQESIFRVFPNPVAMHSHNDRWLLVDSPARRHVWRWIDELVGPGDSR
jgi:hypothetical protein